MTTLASHLILSRKPIGGCDTLPVLMLQVYHQVFRIGRVCFRIAQRSRTSPAPSAPRVEDFAIHAILRSFSVCGERHGPVDRQPGCDTYSSGTAPPMTPTEPLFMPLGTAFRRCRHTIQLPNGRPSYFKTLMMSARPDVQALHHWRFLHGVMSPSVAVHAARDGGLTGGPADETGTRSICSRPDIVSKTPESVKHLPNPPASTLEDADPRPVRSPICFGWNPRPGI